MAVIQPARNDAGPLSKQAQDKRFILPANGWVGDNDAPRDSRPITPLSDARPGSVGENQPLWARIPLICLFLVYKYANRVLTQIPLHPGIKFRS